MRTDWSITYEGFTARFSAVSECGTAANPRKLDAELGFTQQFHDPAGPSAAHASNRDCYWLVTAPSTSSNVRLSFRHMELEKDWDYVHIYDGATANSEEIARKTGTSAAGVYQSTTDKMLVRLKTDDMINWEGFTAAYTAVPEL